MKGHSRGVFLLLLGLSSCSWWQRGPGDRIRVSGNIELTEVKIAFKVPGRLVELNVEEGMPVRAGAVLARLDQVQLQRQRDREQAGLAVAESQLAQLRTAIEYQKAALRAEMELRQAELRQAEARLEELVSGSRRQEIEQATAAVAEARTQNELARKDWERAEVLFKNDDITAAQYDQYRMRLDATTAALRQADERLALVVEGPRKEQIESARAQVERSRAALKLAEAQQLEIRRREQEIESRRADIERARAQIAIIDAQLADAVVSSPIDGIVLVKSAETGEIIAAGTTIATIGNLDRPWLRAYINEQDLGRVKLGARADVTTDSFPGKIYAGRVSFIASEAEFTPKQIQTTEERVKLVYRIKIDLENPNHELKSNMPADADILLK
ncbi:MAG: HlyD family efflux transporter periplasmic adaptor subunit [Acidobacteria bacterium]|nr:HlyD family efflux transporter periplasmic adaptor subunit [Acidobacteriota bacterium]